MADKARSGRPLKLPPQLRKPVRRMARAGKTTRYIVRYLAENHGVTVTRQTVARVLKGGNKPMAWLPVSRGRVLREANKALRVEFCEQHLLDSWKHWKNTVFVDSKYLYVYRDKAKRWLYRWQNVGSKQVFPQNSNPQVFHFYAAVAWGHKSKLVFVPPTKGVGVEGANDKVTFNSSHFIEAMEQLSAEFQQWFPSSRSYRVVWDSARQHTSKEAKAGVARLGIPVMPDFPAQSWDLNIIEVCWAWLSHNVKGHNHRVWDGWEECIKEAWAEVEISSINKLVAKVPKQLQKIAQKEGEWVRYF